MGLLVGPFVERFERDVAAFVRTRFAVAAVNGTAALHIALLVAGVKPGDEVLVSALTFIAPANAIRYAGARPVFIDAEPAYWQMDPQKVIEFLETNCDSARRLALQQDDRPSRKSGAAGSHSGSAGGHRANRDSSAQIQSRRYRGRHREPGAKYRGRMVGSPADVACFSFNGNKIITTGGGGMIVTKRGVGTKSEVSDNLQAGKDDPLEYVHGEIGYNYRLTNLPAALGCAQMEQLRST